MSSRRRIDRWRIDRWGIDRWGIDRSGYWISRGLFQRSSRVRNFVESRGGELMKRLHHGGTYVLAAAALTPLPYSIACWAAGAIKMPFGRFLAVSSLRVVRVAGYLWLIEAGFFSVVD